MAQDIENNSEQFEKIKEFVQRNKKLIIGLVVALLIILIGNDFYQSKQEQNTGEASQLFQKLLISKTTDLEGAKNFSELIKTKGFVGFKFDLQGDIAKKEGDIDKAKELYGKAISSFSPQSDFSRVIEYKLQNL
jgi:predicted negative regulator of RcsB-dependent stress response